MLVYLEGSVCWSWYIWMGFACIACRWEPAHASPEPIPQGAGRGFQQRRQLRHRRLHGDAGGFSLLAGRAAPSVALLQGQVHGNDQPRSVDCQPCEV